MVTNLFVPDRKIVVPKPPSYLKLDMAFAIGAGAKLMDKSRYRAHGTISGADWADGAHGRCLDFVPTVPDYVEIPAAHTQLNFQAEDFSMIARIKIDDLTANREIFMRGLGDTDGYRWVIYRTGRQYVETYQSGAGQSTWGTDGSIVIATWYTIGLSRDGASIRLHLNGVDETVTVGTHIDPATCARSAKIGIYDDKVSEPFDGKFEFLRIFGGIALPASVHLAWHNALA